MQARTIALKKHPLLLGVATRVKKARFEVPIIGMYLRGLLFVAHVLHRDLCDVGIDPGHHALFLLQGGFKRSAGGIHAGQGPMYSDTFAVYPWMVDSRGDGLITQTPSLLAYHEVKRLRGQTMAALSFHQLDRRDVDLLLLNELLKRWERCFSTDSPAVEDERLFRSLNMANAAAKLPAGADTNLYDVVR
jgi:hypothetical protein